MTSSLLPCLSPKVPQRNCLKTVSVDQNTKFPPLTNSIRTLTSLCRFSSWWVVFFFSITCKNVLLKIIRIKLICFSNLLPRNICWLWQCWHMLWCHAQILPAMSHPGMKVKKVNNNIKKQMICHNESINERNWTFLSAHRDDPLYGWYRWHMACCGILLEKQCLYGM